MAYDTPNYTNRREADGGVAGGGATTEYAAIRRFQKCRLIAVHFGITVAGTATAHGFDVLVGTTSVGNIVLSTVAASKLAGTTLVLATAQTVTPLMQMAVKSLADVVGKADVTYQYEILPDAVDSARGSITS